jgi:FkbM family methyltransferase
VTRAFQVWVGERLRWYLTRARHPLKPFVVGRFWSWFANRRVWIRYDTSRAINVHLGDYLQQRIFFDGYYEKPLIDWLRRTLTPADVFWDVGANIGAITLIAAQCAARVVAFEPDPRALASLRRNLEANGVANVDVVPAALGDRDGMAVLHQAEAGNTGMTSLLADRAVVVGTVSVPVMTADDLVARRPELTPHVIKLDVEGAEGAVLAGALRVLESGHVRALVFEDRRGASGQPASTSLTGRLCALGYRVDPLGASDEAAADNLFNFLATRIAS